MRRIRTLLVTLAVLACGACVSIGVAVALFTRAHEVEPIRDIDAVLVTYPQGGHPSVEIVEPATLKVFKDMLNSEREGWRHPLLGEMPVPVAVLALMDGDRRASVRIGVQSLERNNLVKNVPESRVSELLALASGAPEGGAVPRCRGRYAKGRCAVMGLCSGDGFLVFTTARIDSEDVLTGAREGLRILCTRRPFGAHISSASWSSLAPSTPTKLSRARVACSAFGLFLLGCPSQAHPPLSPALSQDQEQREAGATWTDTDHFEHHMSVVDSLSATWPNDGGEAENRSGPSDGCAARGAAFVTWREMPPRPSTDLCPKYDPCNWRLALREGAIMVSVQPLALESEVRPPEVPSFAEPHLEGHAFIGQRWWAHLSDGWLGAFNAGEFGASIWWFSKDGSARKRLGDQHVTGLVDVGGEKWLTVGLDHLAPRNGIVLRVSRIGAHWGLTQVAALEESAYAAAAENDHDALVVTRSQLLRVSRSGQVDKLHTGSWVGLYPSTMVIDAQGRIFVGARHAVIRLDPGADGYSETWLVSPSCVAASDECPCSR